MSVRRERKWLRGMRGHYQKKKNVQSITKEVLTRKASLNVGMLNIEGHREDKMEDVTRAMRIKDLDIMVILETHLRKEQKKRVKMEGCEIFEARREDFSKDKKGGGIAILCRQRGGLSFSSYSPAINNPEYLYVDKERLWVIVTTAGAKTAVCATYLGCDAGDDHHGPWNDGIYAVLSEEIHVLRTKGYRVCLQGDFNGWVGNSLQDGGIPGNTKKVNKNGRRFLAFLRDNNLQHLNGACRTEGDWASRVSSGTWTRHGHDYSSSTVLDYSVISSEHMESVIDLEVDQHGKLGGGADHNILVTRLKDRFLVVSKVARSTIRLGWKIEEDQDWTEYRRVVERELEDSKGKGGGAEVICNNVLSAVRAGLEEGVGRHKVIEERKGNVLPRNLVSLMKQKRALERDWKTKKVKFAESRRSIPQASLVVAAEALQEMRTRVQEALEAFRRQKRIPLLLASRKGNKKSKQTFWRYVSRKERSSSEITSLRKKSTGKLVLTCSFSDPYTCSCPYSCSSHCFCSADCSC